MDRGACGYSPWGHKESDTTEHMYLFNVASILSVIS